MSTQIVQCTDRREAMQSEQLEALQASGLAYLDAEGQWCSNLDGQALADKLIEMNIVVCDFCTRDGVVWDFPARTHVQSVGPTTISVEGWAACEECARLVRSGRREELAERSAREFVRKHPHVPFEFAFAGIQKVQSQFWANREGKGQAYE